MLQTCSTCFHLLLYFSTYHVYYYAPTHQDKFRVCENLLGNKSDSDYQTKDYSDDDRREISLCFSFGHKLSWQKSTHFPFGKFCKNNK